MKEEIECLNAFKVQDQLSHFAWTGNMADPAMRAIIYAETEYFQELERKIVLRNRNVSVSEEKNSVESIEIQI